MNSVSFISLLGGSLAVMELLTLSGSRHLAKYCADSGSECSLTFNIFATSGSCESLMSIFGCVLAWCVAGVNNVTDDFGAEINKELSFRYAVISSR